MRRLAKERAVVFILYATVLSSVSTAAPTLPSLLEDFLGERLEDAASDAVDHLTLPVAVRYLLRCDDASLRDKRCLNILVLT